MIPCFMIYVIITHQQFFFGFMTGRYMISLDINVNVNVVVYSLVSVYILSLDFTFTPWPGFQKFIHTQYSAHTTNPLAARYPLLLGGERHSPG